MSSHQPYSLKLKYVFTYVFSIIAFSALMGYLIAECPCNVNMGTGMLFAVACYTLIVISIVFHYYKLAGIHIGYSILWTFLVSMVATIIIVWIESGITYYNSPLRNYFLQWFATGTGFGAIHGIAMFIMIMVKEASRIAK